MSKHKGTALGLISDEGNYDPSKCRGLFTRRRSLTSQTTRVFSKSAVRATHFTSL